MEISLSELKWEVKGYWPYVPLKEKSMETGQTLHGVTKWIPASVPGGVHTDLFRAGLIENPYYGENSLKCEWVENRWWMYRTSFPGNMNGKDLTVETVSLLFRGLDYEADIYFNDEKLAHHLGMFEPLEVDLTGKIKEENQLLVLFRGIPQEMGQIGYTSMTSTQKSRFNYKWDFSTRMVNIGFWREVVLLIREEVYPEEVFVSSGIENAAGWLRFTAKLSGTGKQERKGLQFRMKVYGPSNSSQSEENQELCADRTFPVEGEWMDVRVQIENAVFWYPNGSGNHPLYQIQAELSDGERVLWQGEWKKGICSITLLPNENAPLQALPYMFCVNGEKVYIKGVNMTPLDHMYGNVTKAQYAHMVAAMVNANVNLVRVWGGGLIEKEEFYELCDENGILIWQEFIQSSSGIDNKPCEEETFCRLLLKNATAAVKEKRNHTALAVYSGGNELMEKENTPCGLDNKVIRMLADVVKEYDPERCFLPTSASGPREFLSTEKGVSHDVHGSWRYEGNPFHYQLYGESDSLFHSEFGMDGTSCVKSLRKFLPEESLRPTPMSGDENWQHHGEWWGTYFRDCEMFGTIEKRKEKLQEFVACSQYLQAEGLRFILEANRRRAFENSGMIVWQLNEPWPNASCTNLVDYYGETKPAYYALKKSCEPFHISLDYRNLYQPEGSVTDWWMYLSDSGAGQLCFCEAGIYDKQGKLLWQTKLQTKTRTNRSVKAAHIEALIPSRVEGNLLFVRLKAESERGEKSENWYVFGTKEQNTLAPLKSSRARVVMIEEETKKLDDGKIRKTICLKNEGEEIAVQTGVEGKNSTYRMLAEDNFVTLLPGEEKKVDLLLLSGIKGVFEQENEEVWQEDAGLVVSWMGQE